MDSASVGPLRVLLVEDEVSLRSVLAAHLRRRGCEVTELESAEAALVGSLRAKGGYDVVVTDIHLSGLSGLDLLRVFRARRRPEPVVLITGDADVGLEREARREPVALYLVKPFEPGAFCDAVEAAAAARRRANHAGA